jgi:purine-binding chemotaxis protein CheW
MHGTVVGRSTGRWPGQCLAFVVGGQPYAVPILVVQEIRRYSEPTVLPGVPPHVLGVINLRGTVVPVFDLRLRFGLGTAVFDRLTVTIIVVVGGRYVGIVADEVSKVMAPEVSAYREGPELASHIDVSFVHGLVQDGTALVTLLDVEKLLLPELGSLE